MAKVIGMDLFFDVYGVCTLRPIPDPTTAALAWNYREGSQAIILDIRKDFDDESNYNVVVVDGENSANTAPVRAISYDNNPNSPTYYGGPYGQVVNYQKSTGVTTQAQAQAMADGLLLKGLGTVEGVNFPAVCHPAHQEDDIVQIVRGRMGMNARYALDSIAIPLQTTAALQAVTRKILV
jgi:hypothetical protein